MKLFTGIAAVVIVIAGMALWLGNNNQTNQPATNQTNDETITVTTSIYPLAYLAERIAGENTTVVNVGANQDPHDFRPTARDIQSMIDADLVIIQGAELEPWGDDVIAQLDEAGTQYLVASSDIDLYKLEDGEHKHEEDHHDEHDDEHHHDEESHDAHSDEHEHDSHDEHGHDDHGHHHGEYDPHTWLDPVLMQMIASNISQTLGTIDPANADTYTQNLVNLQADLAAIDAEYRTGLASCSLDEVITSHDAFGYIGRSYDFEIHAIGGLSTQDIPSAQTLAGLREEAAEGIGAILLEENSISAYGETLARETGLQTLPINPIVSVIPEGQDYLSIMRSNLVSFRAALDCNE